MKYEAVFGDQSLFDGCYDETASIVIATSNGLKFVADESTEYGIVDGDVKSDGLRIAMRRIIAEPKRWTVEDQKAGRLPEVGCRVSYLGIEYDVLAIDKHNVCFLGIDKELYLACISSVKPIETPAEKAQREEDEWVNKAWSETAVFAGVAQDEHDRLRIHLRHIYKAQLSGELQAPKGGE